MLVIPERVAGETAEEDARVVQLQSTDDQIAADEGGEAIIDIGAVRREETRAAEIVEREAIEVGSGEQVPAQALDLEPALELPADLLEGEGENARPPPSCSA